MQRHNSSNNINNNLHHRAANNQSPMPVITGSPLDGPADCTLACDEGHLTAHKIMLCAHSKYLQDILGKFPNAEHPIIILTELNITDIKILVNYMYTGELVITNDGSPSSLLRAAQILKIDSLTDFDDDEDQHQASPSPQSHSPSPQQYHSSSTSNNNNNNHHLHLNQTQLNNNNNNNINTSNNDNNSNISNNSSNSNTKGSNKNNNNNNSINHPSHHYQRSPTPSSMSPTLIKDCNNKIRCHLCNIGLSDVKCLYRHVLTRHLPEKWGYKCEFCDREFSRDDHLMRHYTTKHKNMDFNREKIRETRRLNREMAKNFHDQISKMGFKDFKDELVDDL